MVRDNLRAGLDRVAESLADGTFHMCGPKGSAPPSQSGRLTLALLDGLEAEIQRREERTMDPIEVRRQILARLDDWDEDHSRADCPFKGCIHDAVTALRAVLVKGEQIRAESPKLGWGIADTYLGVVAEAFGIDTKESA